MEDNVYRGDYGSLQEEEDAYLMDMEGEYIPEDFRD